MILKKKIPRDFYKLFRTQNMDYYMQLLTALYQAMQEAYALTQLTDSECRSILAETIARVNMVWWDDETEKTEDEGFPGLSPSAVLDRLVKWGWLSSDFDEKLNCYIIGFPEYSRLYAELFDRLGKEDDSMERESILSVYSALYTYDADPEKIIADIEKKFSYPVIVKPINLGSSIGISKAHDTDGLENSLSNAFDYADRVLVEPAIENLREINCSVLGDRHSARASVCEEPLNATDILSYEDKYIGNASKSGSKGMASTQRRIPADIPKETENEIREMAVRAFRVLGCSGVSRIDFMIDATTGKVWLNEINTIPGSLSFYLWEPLGVKYTELIDEMISLAMKRERERESITYSFDTNVLSGIKLGGKKTGKM